MISGAPPEDNSAANAGQAAPAIRAPSEPSGILAWEDFSRLCKGPLRADIVSLHFRWGAATHVHRRLLSTRSLPNLRQLHVHGVAHNALTLLRDLEMQDRGLERMTIRFPCNHAGSKQLRFDIVTLGERQWRASVIQTGEETMQDWEILYEARCLGLDGILDPF